MEFVTLRRAGGSLVLTIPKTYARALHLEEGERIGVSLDEGKLIADPGVSERVRYRLDDLIAQCDPSAPLTSEDNDWLNDAVVGDEAI